MPLALRQLIPPLTAHLPDGRTIRAWDFKQKKNLVIAFLHSGCARCEDFLKTLVAGAKDFAEQEAVALIVFAETPSVRLAEMLPPQILAAADMSGRSQRAFLGNDVFAPGGQTSLGVFVTDRFGELYAQWVARSEAELPGAGEILGWLGQIQVACEECGAPHWPAES